VSINKCTGDRKSPFSALIGHRLLALVAVLSAVAAGPANSDMRPIQGFDIDLTEVTIGSFRQFVDATGTVTLAERQNGGLVYSTGWQRQPGWTWATPFGVPAGDDEPAVHVTFDEAAAFCRWAGKRLPQASEWRLAAYTEMRPAAPPPFRQGRSYPYPTGDTPMGANCYQDCGATAAIDHRAVLHRGIGHAPAGRSKAGVNGLYDMAANVWEWVDTWADADRRDRRLTLGGSWWYGAAQMHRDHSAGKPPDMAVVYIGFRCAQDWP
jgi:formylglycine-generating enzyme required for sulfatase activity